MYVDRLLYVYVDCLLRGASLTASTSFTFRHVRVYVCM